MKPRIVTEASTRSWAPLFDESSTDPKMPYPCLKWRSPNLKVSSRSRVTPGHQIWLTRCDPHIPSRKSSAPECNLTRSLRTDRRTGCARVYSSLYLWSLDMERVVCLKFNSMMANDKWGVNPSRRKFNANNTNNPPPLDPGKKTHDCYQNLEQQNVKICRALSRFKAFCHSNFCCYLT